MNYFENFSERNGEIVDGRWIKWIHRGVPDLEGVSRDYIRYFLATTYHCLKCTALSGCYFLLLKKPGNIGTDGLLHENCDCTIKLILKPKGEVKAFCAIEKFSKYVFSEKYRHKGKLDLFEALGFDINDSAFLKMEYERQARQKYLNGDYELKKLDEYGQNINIEIILDSTIKKGIKFISGWKVHPLGYITCNTPFAAV